MNRTITYTVRRNVAATDAKGHACMIAMALVRFPDGTTHPVAIPEGLLATVPPADRDDFIAHEIETLIGYEVTRTH